MDKFFDKLPYETLEDIKFSHLIAGAVGLGLVVIAAYYFTLFSATNTELTKLVKKKETAERTLKRHKSIVRKGDLTAKSLARISGQLEAYKKQMPIVDDLPKLLQKVSGFGENRKIELLTFQLEEGSVNDFYKEIPLQIRLRGDLWSTLDFFEYMQNLLQLVSFENLTLESLEVPIVGPNGPTGQSAFLLQTAMTAKTYSFIEGSEEKQQAAKKPKAKPKKKVKKKSGH
ncbi:MAG: type 4a pilus biogenesis protein PilO [Nitrospina sp.]|jgi:type IV pilus assembly protein PilO|nr:type 4a pilus biogenesis protein PilO [Nitrospina sp.]MBT6716561.1 type 4a pilus biogenesis protein PilO [Nitrospina sp.]